MNTLMLDYSKSTNVGLLYWNSANKRITLVGDYQELQAKISNGTILAIQLVKEISACKVLNVAVYEVLDELDSVFEYLNTSTISEYDKAYLLDSEITGVVGMLSKVRENLTKLNAFDLGEVQVTLNSSLKSLNSNSVLLESYESLSVKISALLNLLTTKLEKLNSLDYNVSNVESYINSSYEFIRVNAESDSLKTSLLNTSSRIADDVTKISTYSALFCGRVSELAVVLQNVEKNVELANSLAVRSTSLADSIEKIYEVSDRLTELNQAASDRCAELDEFVRCLQVYESQMLKSGSNVALEKEDKVFVVNGITPPIPECPPIVYFVPTTTPSPNKTSPNATTTAGPPTTTGSPCTALTVIKNGNTKWFFTHTANEDTFSRAVGMLGLGDADVILSNTDNLDVTATLTIAMELQSDNNGRLQVFRDLQPVTATSITGQSTLGVAASIAPQFISLQGGGQTYTTQTCEAFFVVVIKSKESANLFFRGSLAGKDDSKGNDKWFIKSAKLTSLNAAGATCDSGLELANTDATAIDDFIDSIPWGPKYSHEHSKTFVRDVAQDQQWASKDGQPRYVSNQYTTGKNSMSTIRLVLCIFNYELSTGRIFHCYMYSNLTCDMPGDALSLINRERELVNDWCSFSKGNYKSVETTDWRVMREISNNGGFYGV